jgi:hypothetical protein
MLCGTAHALPLQEVDCRAQARVLRSLASHVLHLNAVLRSRQEVKRQDSIFAVFKLSRGQTCVLRLLQVGVPGVLEVLQVLCVVVRLVLHRVRQIAGVVAVELLSPLCQSINLPRQRGRSAEGGRLKLLSTDADVYDAEAGGDKQLIGLACTEPLPSRFHTPHRSPIKQPAGAGRPPRTRRAPAYRRRPGPGWSDPARC